MGVDAQSVAESRTGGCCSPSGVSGASDSMGRMPFGMMGRIYEVVAGGSKAGISSWVTTLSCRKVVAEERDMDLCYATVLVETEESNDSCEEIQAVKFVREQIDSFENGSQIVTVLASSQELAQPIN
jgi:hypothetical protein